MSDNDNPFGAIGSPYSQKVSYGAPDAVLSNGPNTSPAPIKDTTTAHFASDVIQESRKQPVLVDFWAPWCGPCKQLQPALERAVAAAGGRVKLVKMNIDDHPAIAGQLGIQSIPAVIAFKDGQPADGFMGAVPESQINAFIEKLVGKDGVEEQVAEALQAARQARESGDPQTAAGIYDAVLQQAPDNIEAIAGLADMLFEAGDVAGAEEVLSRCPPAEANAAAIVGVRTKIALAAEAERLGDPAEFERRLAENPKDFQARYDLAMIQNAQGNRQEAADNLLAIVMADRTWNDDGARAQLIKLFEAWGPTDEVTLSTRRRLSSLLFS